ncbi:MAG: hypothetical protein AB7O43_06250 [Hyphomicrobiaceae bacterium]
MSPELAGLGIGAILGLGNFIVLSMLAGRLAMDKDLAKRRTAGMLKGTAWFELVLFPALGWFIAPLVVQ